MASINTAKRAKRSTYKEPKHQMQRSENNINPIVIYKIEIIIIQQ